MATTMTPATAAAAATPRIQVIPRATQDSGERRGFGGVLGDFGEFSVRGIGIQMLAEHYKNCPFASGFIMC
ncbi:hypothetical protein SDC9_80193 [bioreactor metagenome]|uniref:Uncharacterized protein n=1 Tax=bioreactor metagenome TaxID=1076179 RepID=A0A644YYJ4_9ZZZZ